MTLNFKIVDYTKMNLKELEKERLKVGEDLLNKIDDKRYHNKEGIKLVKSMMSLYMSLSKMQSKLESQNQK